MRNDVPGSAVVRSRVRAIVLGVAALAHVGLPGSAGAASLDLDRDGLRNTFETGRSLTNPRLADTDRDGTPDGAEDPDADGLPSVAEQAAGTNPRAGDTDRDGTGDATDPDPLHAPAPVLPGAESCTVFPVTNVWNTPIDTRPVRADSASNDIASSARGRRSRRRSRARTNRIRGWRRRWPAAARVEPPRPASPAALLRTVAHLRAVAPQR